MIELGNNYFIDTDEYQYIVKKWIAFDKNGDDCYKILSYHQTLTQALESVMRKYQRSIVSESTMTLKDTIDEFLEEFPYIKQGIDLILKEVANRESLINTITEGLTGLMQGLTDGIEKAQEEGVDNNLLKLMDMFKTWKDTQETSEE